VYFVQFRFGVLPDMHYRNRKLSVSLCVFVRLVSCSDEFVNRDVAYSIDSENYFNSKSDYDNALVALRLTTILLCKCAVG
jgi:hypothetical protein